MIVKQLAAFDSDLPYDAIEDEHNFIQWPGRNVAEAIVEILSRLGCTEVAIDILDERGYEVVFSLGKRQFGARVSMIDQYMVGFSQYSFIDGMMRRLRPEYLDILRRVNGELNKDSRFHNIRWYGQDELFSGIEGALSPVEE